MSSRLSRRGFLRNASFVGAAAAVAPTVITSGAWGKMPPSERITLGFIGTVVGIAFALADAGQAEEFQDQQFLRDLTKNLAVAFYTTLLALIHSTVLVFSLHIAQAKEELALNRAGQYCLDNLINRLYER